MIDEAVSELQTRFDPFNENDFERLKFSVNDVICSVINSSYTCGKMQPNGLFFFPNLFFIKIQNFLTFEKERRQQKK